MISMILKAQSALYTAIASPIREKKMRLIATFSTTFFGREREVLQGVGN